MISNKPRRQTPQKRFVEACLAAHKDHPTAEQLYQELQTAGHSVGLTSVYRILEGFVAQGKAVAIKAAGEVHYDWVRNDHYHFVCDQCGKIIDLSEDKDLFAKLAAEHSFRLLSLQGVVIHGLCQDCAKAFAEMAKLPQEEKNKYGKRSKTPSHQ